MDESSILCVAVEEGVDCIAEAAMVAPVPLCARHQFQIALLVVPDLLATAVRQAGTDSRPISLPPAERAAVIAGAQPQAVGTYMGGPHSPMVYFVENGDRVKIGHSTNLRSRVKSLSLQEKNVVLLLRGGLTLERALHATYDKERIDSTEWFTKSERLAAFIESKQADLSGRHRHEMQRRARRQMVTAAATVTGRRSPAQWAALVVPIYRQFVADHGRAPSAPVLAELVRVARPDLPLPGSERSWRLIRQALEDQEA